MSATAVGTPAPVTLYRVGRMFRGDLPVRMTTVEPSSADVEEPLPDLRTRNETARTSTDELVPVTGDEVVKCIANRSRDHPSDNTERPPTTEVTRDAQRRFGADRHRLRAPIRVRVHPYDRVNRSKLAMARADCRPVVSLQGGKAQGLSAVMAQDKLNAPGAEATRAVIEEDGCLGRGIGHGRFPAGRKADHSGGICWLSAVA